MIDMLDEKRERAAFYAYANAHGLERAARVLVFNHRSSERILSWDALWARLQQWIDNPGFDFVDGAL
jgi:hypothetical protein